MEHTAVLIHVGKEHTQRTWSIACSPCHPKGVAYRQTYKKTKGVQLTY